MRFPLRLLYYSLMALTCYACTPKAAPTATTKPGKKPALASRPAAAGEELSACKKFTDAPNPDQAETDYVIYRQLLKAKNMQEAMKNWRKVYAVSPAADGRRSTVFTDGVAFYNDLIQQNPDRKAVYGDTLLMLYSEARGCYPGNGYMAAIQGFDSYYTYPGTATDEEMFALFKESIELDGQDKLQYFVINPMSGLTVKLYRDGKITEAEAQEVVQALRFRLNKGLTECSGQECAPWEKINDYAPGALKFFETVKGFYDCQYFVDTYYQPYKENPDDCDAITTAFGRMRFGGCDDSTPEFAEVKAAYTNNCREVPSENSGAGGTWVTSVRAAYKAYEDGNAREAVQLFEEALPNIPDEKRARYEMLVAKIYYRDLRNFSQARAYARKAAKTNPGSGEPYMLIGTLYASSGPLCGPGTGFDSQVVTWPAIDMWQRAKSVDGSVAAEANRLINRYTQYMPTKSDIFQRGLQEGGNYTVGCWINETTKIRTP